MDHQHETADRSATDSEVAGDLRFQEEPRKDVVSRILALMGPIVVGSILAFSAQAITNSFVGRRLGPDVFAHYTLGISVANLFGFSVGIGLNGALDTFISQAYGRDKQATKDIGVSVQRAGIVSAVFAVPLSLILLYGGPIFQLMFGDELGIGALEFTRHAVPNLILSFGTNILTKTLQAINKPELALYSTVVSSVSCFVVNYFITTSVATAVLSLTVTFAIQLVVLALLIRYHPEVTFWKHCDWPSKDAYELDGIRQFLRVGIPSMVAVCAEWWAFEILDVVAASISVKAVAAVNLVLTIGSMYFSIALSIAVATSVLVGNALGENRPALAKQYTYTGLAICQLLNLFNAAGLVLFRHEIARIFTQDAELENTFCAMIIVIAVYICGDSTQYSLQSIFRSTGQQRTAAKVVMLSLWAVGVPMSVVLGKWAALGAAGVIMGLVCGFVIEVPMMVVSLLRWPWEELATVASKRLDEDDSMREGGQHHGVEDARVHPHEEDDLGVSSAAKVLGRISQAAHTMHAGRRSTADDEDDHEQRSLRGSIALSARADTEMSRNISSEVLRAAAVGAAVHMMTPEVGPLRPARRSNGVTPTVSPRNLDGDGFGLATRPVVVGSLAGGAIRTPTPSRAASTPNHHAHHHPTTSAAPSTSGSRPLTVGGGSMGIRHATPPLAATRPLVAQPVVTLDIPADRVPATGATLDPTSLGTTFAGNTTTMMLSNDALPSGGMGHPQSPKLVSGRKID